MDQHCLLLYQRAVALLREADDRPEAEIEAERALSRAVSLLDQPNLNSGARRQKRRRRSDAAAEATQELLCELLLVLGRVVEWRDPERARTLYARASTLDPQSAEANLQLARLRWKTSHEAQHLAEVEDKLRCAVKLSEGNGDDEMCRDGMELLARLLSQRVSGDGVKEAHAILLKLGFTHALTPSLASPSAPALGIRSRLRHHGSKLSAAREASGAVVAFDQALPQGLLALMREGFARTASFWSENNYGSPRTGFFSFKHRLPEFPPPAVDPEIGLDLVLQHIWRVAATAVPAVRKARWVEWWAHCREHSAGHQIHFDSVPGKRAGEPRHPIISTITFLTADCGGPTLVTDQTIQSRRTTKGWLARPQDNRLICFDGSLLHCVLPGAGVAPSTGARRTTFMAAFWEEDPGQGVEISSLLGGRRRRCARGERSSAAAPPGWPSSFSVERLEYHRQQQLNAAGPEDSKVAVRNDSFEAVTPLGADEIWIDLRQEDGANRTKKSATEKKARRRKVRSKRVDDVGGDEGQLDLLGTKGLYSLSNGLLGVGMRAAKLSY